MIVSELLTIRSKLIYTRHEGGFYRRRFLWLRAGALGASSTERRRRQTTATAQLHAAVYAASDVTVAD